MCLTLLATNMRYIIQRRFRSSSTIYIILPVFCLSVWHYIDSAPGRDTDLRPVSLEPARTGPTIFGKKFSRKVTSGQITEEKLYDTNGFLWEKYRAFCFNVWKAIISFHFEQLGQVITRTYRVITSCYEKF